MTINQRGLRHIRITMEDLRSKNVTRFMVDYNDREINAVYGVLE